MHIFVKFSFSYFLSLPPLSSGELNSALVLFLFLTVLNLNFNLFLFYHYISYCPNPHQDLMAKGGQEL